MKNEGNLKVALAQISPIWLNKSGTLDKIKDFVIQAGKQECDFVIFGEGLLPGYPFCLSLANGGSCIAGPDGEWIVEPITDKEGLFVHTLNTNRVLEERQNFNGTGHYSIKS